MIAVIGGGIIGLAIAWRFASAGHRVKLFDAGEIGAGASHAAAGMLTARMDAGHYGQDIIPLLVAARDIWPDFAHSLASFAEHDLDYQQSGSLMVAFNRDDRAQLTREFSANHDGEFVWLQGAELYEKEPHLGYDALAAVFSPKDHWVDNRRVIGALQLALGKVGVECIQNCAINAVACDGIKAPKLQTSKGEIDVKMVIIATGIGRPSLTGLPDSIGRNMRPVKGQIMAIDASKGPHLGHAVWYQGCYMVPRADGRIVIGATVEEKSDTQVTVEGLDFLMERARRMFPSIDDCPVVDMWAGLRPSSVDGLPLIGPIAPGVIVALGHFRNGILLAPKTADIVYDYYQGRRPDPLWQVCDPGRFTD